MYIKKTNWSKVQERRRKSKPSTVQEYQDKRKSVIRSTVEGSFIIAAQFIYCTCYNLGEKGKKKWSSLNFSLISLNWTSLFLMQWCSHQQSRGHSLTYEPQTNMKNPKPNNYITYFRCLRCMHLTIPAQQNKLATNHLPQVRLTKSKQSTKLTLL